MVRGPRRRGDRTVKSGHLHHGKPRFRCQGRGRQLVPDPARPRVSEEQPGIVDRPLRERLSLAGIARAAGVGEAWAQRRANARFRAAPAPTAGEERRRVGDRSAVGAQALREPRRCGWARPQAYRNRALRLTDQGEACAAALPAAQRLPVSKRSGLTSGIERFGDTVRQRLGRLTRKTLSFSKSWENHVGSLRCFNEDCNRELPLLT